MNTVKNSLALRVAHVGCHKVHSERVLVSAARPRRLAGLELGVVGGQPCRIDGPVEVS
jgi:hypothetical protein